MMVKMSKFPKIGQYPQEVREVQMMSAYTGKDDLGNAIYDSTLPKPILEFKGLVKLHGTNAGLGGDSDEPIWVQSRSNIITVGNDNAGFAAYVMGNEQVFLDLIEHVRDVEGDNITEDDGVVIFGEWAGGNIQKGVAITGIPKSFFIFDVKIVPSDGSDSYYVESEYLKDVDNRVYNISDYLSYHITIDFNRPDLAQEEMAKITDEVEKLCPVGKAFGIEGIGEGVVWSTTYKGSKLRFKVKGEKHAGASKVKTLKPVDSERISRFHDLVNTIVTGGRLQQMFDLACDTINGGLPERKFLGDYIRMVIKDTMEEDIVAITEAGFEPKEINKYISEVARAYFFEKEKL